MSSDITTRPSGSSTTLLPTDPSHKQKGDGTVQTTAGTVM